MEQTARTAHILMFPLPIQGAINSTLKLAELLLLASHGQIHITFLTTEHVHNRLKLHSKATTRFDAYPSFSFLTFPDGLPEDHPRGSDKFMEMVAAVEAVSRPLIRNMLKSTDYYSHGKPITCMIPDGSYNFALDMGKESGVPVIYFDTISPCCLWVYLCLPILIEAGEVPFQESDENLEALVTIPGMRNLLRRRDLPDFCRANNPTSDIMIRRISEQAKKFSKASGFIMNTFEDLDLSLLSYIRSNFPYNMYVVGPLHLSLKERLVQEETTREPLRSYGSNSFLSEDKSPIQWLNQQRPKSVLYCSFGSQVLLTKEQLIEFWDGLVNSRIRFLWVKRPHSIIGMDDDVHKWSEVVSTDLLNGVKENGYVTTWVPQEEVLIHPSIGGFLTHSGWNSTIESIVAGVPMICWPHYVDQLVNSRYVSHVWKVGLDIKDTCDKVTIENMVRDLMERRKDEFSKNASELANLSKQSVMKDQSSYDSLDKLVDDIMSFRLQV